MDAQRLRSGVRGSLLAGAVGDALGAPLEGASLAAIRARFGPQGVADYAPGRVRPGAVTDDTQMTLFTAEGLVLAARAGALGRWDETARIVHRAYLRWLRAQGVRSAHASFAGAAQEGWLWGRSGLDEPRGPGATCLAGLRGSRMGRVEQPLNHSKGCGGVMRIAPVGLALAVDDPFELARRVAALTHGHPTGQLAAGFQALLVRELLLGTPLADALDEALAVLRRLPGHEETTRAVTAASARAAGDAPSAEVVETLGAGWVAEEALAIAVYAARAAPDLESGLRLAVNHGGDSDSTGAVAGSLLGVLYGEAAIPVRWLAGLELRETIAETADALLAECMERTAPER